MSSNSLIAKSVILVSALVGGVVGLFELGDRFMTSKPSEDVVVSQSAASGSSDAAERGPDEADAAGETTVALSESVSSADRGQGTALEREIAQRVSEQLMRLECGAVEVTRVTATATTVPEEETSHGFEGHLLNGAVTLQGANGPERIRLAGSGKGPTGAASAVDMALRGFGEHLTVTEIFEANCRGD